MSNFPPALPHGELRELIPGLHYVTGAMKMNALMSFDRSMVAVVEGERVVLLNPVRLDEDGLKALDALGKVTDVVRVGAFHGRDDGFYVDRYGATLWAPEGCARRHNPQPLVEGGALPIEGAEVFVFQGIDKPEAVLRLPHQGGTLVPCDALQNWHKPHPEFSTLPANLMMRVMGFFTPTTVGIAWRKAMKPQASELHRLLDGWNFDNLLPAHGDPVIGDAKARYSAQILKLFPR